MKQSSAASRMTARGWRELLDEPVAEYARRGGCVHGSFEGPDCLGSPRGNIAVEDGALVPQTAAEQQVGCFGDDLAFGAAGPNGLVNRRRRQDRVGRPADGGAVGTLAWVGRRAHLDVGRVLPGCEGQVWRPRANGRDHTVRGAGQDERARRGLFVTVGRRGEGPLDADEGARGAGYATTGARS